MSASSQKAYTFRIKHSWGSWRYYENIVGTAWHGCCWGQRRKHLFHWEGESWYFLFLWWASPVAWCYANLLKCLRSWWNFCLISTADSAELLESVINKGTTNYRFDQDGLILWSYTAHGWNRIPMSLYPPIRRSWLLCFCATEISEMKWKCEALI